MKAIVLLGPPGAGKGTVGGLVREELPYREIATGDLLRAAVNAGTALGLKASEFMKKGELVPDEIIVGLVEEELDNIDSDLMLDGFPRSLAQAKLLDAALEGRGVELHKVFYLTAPKDLIVWRLCGRRICKTCNMGYHVTNRPPKTAGICDGCGSELSQRPDDTEETILKRLDVYNNSIKDMIAYYEAQGKLAEVDSSREGEETAVDVVAILK